MTDELREILIAKMIDAPESLSNEELELIITDDELREIYEASSALSDATAEHDFDMSHEWEMLRPRLRKRPLRIGLLFRVAAIVVGVAVLSGLLYNVTDKTDSQQNPATIHLITSANPPVKQVVDQEITPQEDADQAVQPAVQKPVRRKVVETPAETPETIDIEEYIRIQNANTDNEIAMLNSEEMVEELMLIQAIYELTGEDYSYIKKEINTVTMQ